MKKKILVIAAHPDDEVLGCGGIIARYAKSDADITVLILGEGVTSRDKNRDRTARNIEIETLRREAVKANQNLGVKKVIFYDYPDNRFDTVPLIDIIKTIEKAKTAIKPDIIFTHYEKDLNIDHQIVYKATLVATRPSPSETVKEIYSFEIPSSTEWNYPVSFSPDIFFDISGSIKLKLKALKCYKSELRRFPHPRSLENINIVAKYWGAKSGKRFVEAFKVVRITA